MKQPNRSMSLWKNRQAAMKLVSGLLAVSMSIAIFLVILVLISQPAEAVVFDGQVTAAADDGFSDDTTFYPSELYYLVGLHASLGIFDTFARFTNVVVPADATIDVAYISVTSRGSANDGSQDTNIYFEAGDNPAAPTTRADHIGRTRTTTFTAWDNVDYTDDVEVDSPSIVSVIQELVDAAYWDSGDSAILLWDDDGSPSGSYLNHWAYEGDTARVIKLHVEFTVSQFARPDSDVTDGGWEDTTGGDSDGANWDEMNETTPDDGSSYTRAGSSATIMEVGLSDVTDPVSSSGHIIRFRAFATGGGGPERITFDLVETSTVIASISSQAITRSSWNTYSYTLSGSEADSIGDYTDLRFRFTPTASGSDTIDVTWAELEIPVVPVGDCETLTVIVNNPQSQMYFNGTTDDPAGGLWQEENVSEDYQTTVTPAINVTNDDGSQACDVTLELLTSPGAGRTMKYSLTSTAPNPGSNNIPVGSNVTVKTSLGSGSTQAVYLWVDYDDSQGGSVSPTLRVDTELP